MMHVKEDSSHVGLVLASAYLRLLHGVPPRPCGCWHIKFVFVFPEQGGKSRRAVHVGGGKNAARKKGKFKQN